MRETFDESCENMQPPMLPEEVVEKFINWFLSQNKIDLQTGTHEKTKYLSETFILTIENLVIDDNLKSVLILLGETKPSKVSIKETLISGAHSQVIVQTNQGVKMQVDLQIEYGEWKITNLARLTKR